MPGWYGPSANMSRNPGIFTLFYIFVRIIERFEEIIKLALKNGLVPEKFGHPFHEGQRARDRNRVPIRLVFTLFKDSDLCQAILERLEAENEIVQSPDQNLWRRGK